MDHDAERALFLKTASPSGLLLALSTAGGSTGTRSFPLMRTDADWAAITGNVVTAGKGGEIADQQTLLRGLNEALIASRGSAHSDIDRVTAVAQAFLEALREGWTNSPSAIPIVVLELFYDLSISVAELVPSPPLEPTWLASAARVQEVLAGGLDNEDDFTAARELARLVRLLQENEPRFLRMLDLQSEVVQPYLEFCDQVNERLKSFDDLDPYEDELVEEPRGAQYWAPAYPDSSESGERYWLTAATDAMSDIGVLDNSLSAKIAEVEALIDEHLHARETRKERFEEWESSQGDDSDAWAAARDQGSGDFDLVAFFSDL